MLRAPEPRSRSAKRPGISADRPDEVWNVTMRCGRVFSIASTRVSVSYGTDIYPPPSPGSSVRPMKVLVDEAGLESVVSVLEDEEIDHRDHRFERVDAGTGGTDELLVEFPPADRTVEYVRDRLDETVSRCDISSPSTPSRPGRTAVHGALPAPRSGGVLRDELETWARNDSQPAERKTGSIVDHEHRHGRLMGVDTERLPPDPASSVPRTHGQPFITHRRSGSRADARSRVSRGRRRCDGCRRARRRQLRVQPLRRGPSDSSRSTTPYAV